MVLYTKHYGTDKQRLKPDLNNARRYYEENTTGK
jgi:hypothetical protein